MTAHEKKLSFRWCIKPEYGISDPKFKIEVQNP